MLALEHIAKSYGSKDVVHDLSLSLEAGKIGCLLGPSGCGKTTVLRLIAGFETLQGGSISLAGQVISSPGHCLSPEQRQVGLVFQDYALFPHLTVAENLAFGLQQWSKPERAARVERLLGLVGLEAEAKRLPHQLSGGQQQRVALARALAPKPRLLLLDEPFSNLDVELRERLSLEVRDILKQEGITALLVTHDQHEAFALADRIAVMHAGTIQQWDSAYGLYHRPANRMVADFIGQGVLLDGQVLAGNQVQIELGTLPALQPLPEGTRVDVLIRPDDILHDDLSPIQAEVARRTFRGAEFLYTLKLPSGQQVLALVPSHHDHAIGEMIGICLDVEHGVVFERTPPR